MSRGAALSRAVADELRVVAEQQRLDEIRRRVFHRDREPEVTRDREGKPLARIIDGPRVEVLGQFRIFPRGVKWIACRFPDHTLRPVAPEQLVRVHD